MRLATPRMWGAAGIRRAGLNTKRSHVSISNPACSMPARGVAREVAAARDVRPQRGVGELLYPRLALPVRAHVLVEAQLPSGPEHPAELGERELLVGDGAQHERGHRDVELAVPAGQAPGVAVEHRHLHGRHCAASRWRRGAQMRLGLDGEDLA